MKFKKLVEGIELPEKTSPQRFTNVRANRRIDVCSGDTVRVSTGIHVTVSKNETARLLGIASGVVAMDVTTGELFIDIYNKYKQNLMIYPGMVLAEILVEKAPVKASTRKRKTAKFTSSAKVVKSGRK
jgi:dUTPase